MSPSIAEMAEHGAQELVQNAEQMLRKILVTPGPRTRLSFSNSIYYLPIALAHSAQPIERVGDLPPAVQKARALLVTEPAMATLLAAEATEALCAVEAAGARAPGTTISSPIGDTAIRTWGVQLADGRMPGIALILGSARSNAVAAALVEELRLRNILCLLGGGVNGNSIAQQLKQEGVQLGEPTGIVALGAAPTSAVHALGFVTRSAMRLGGHKPGTWDHILKHSKRRSPGFVLALGELDSGLWAMALAAQEFGFSVIADTALPEAGEVTSVPFESLKGKDDAQRARALVEKCVSVRKLRVKQYKVPVPVAYGPAFEEETLSPSDVQVQLGGKGAQAFELLQTASTADTTDGKIEVIGPDPFVQGAPAPANFGLLVKVSGKGLETDFEPYLERQIQLYLSYARGVQHTGSGDSISIMVSKAAAAQGFTLQSIGKVLHARYHEELPASIEKVHITLITEPESFAKWQAKAREVHDTRNKRVASLTDRDVDEFYVCTNCRTFAPNNVSIISPERVSPCGQCNWLDARAGYALNAAGVRRPVKLGKPIDAKKGIWEGTNEYAKTASHGRVNEVALYSIAQSPMCACGDFECAVMTIPEANGVMILSHDDTSATPAGINVETYASIAAGEQIPGVVGVGKSHLLSPKFIAAEGGFKRVVWMSSVLKESMAEELKAVCAREGDPNLLEKIADERQVTTVEQLIRWMKEHRHPALEMEKMY